MNAPFKPISPNPYIVGNPVRGRAMFFGRDAEFQLIRKRFEHAERGGLLVFCGERRSGKTSILFQILDHRLGPDFIPVLIDMQSMSVASEPEFLARVGDEILAALGGPGTLALPDYSQTGSAAAVFARFVQGCLTAHPGKKLILLFDEYELFENKIEAGVLSPDVLGILAALMERASVFMVFTGSQHLEQRRAPYWSILGKSGYKTVSFLEHNDAVNLVRQPVEGRLHYPDEALSVILRLTAGQPFYTQAICQSLVDLANDRASGTAGREAVDEVVEALINNPLPQMIFLWDGLESDDKLVLSLLAECIESPDAHATAADLLAHLRRGKYPLDLDNARIATALEKNFKSEMLLRRDEGPAPAYAFRMDLWRQWIRRQHSLWQVMREVGLEIRKAAPLRGVPPWLVAAGLVVIAVAVWWRLQAGPGAVAPPGSAPLGLLVLEVEPAEAVIRLDGQRAGLGSVRDSVAAEFDHRVEISAPGYADSAFTLRIAAGDSASKRVELRPLYGDLAVETVPPGAEVRIGGRVVGRSPLTVPGLPAARAHRVEAARDGFGVARSEVRVGVGEVTRIVLTLEQGRTDVMVTTEPGGATLTVDGAPRGVTPVTVSGLTLGRHTFATLREGHERAETTLVVTDATRSVAIALRREAPGVLVVLGDLPAQIYVNGTLVVENVQNSGPRSLPPGDHSVRVVLVSGETIDQSVSVRSGERTLYDFSRKQVTRRPEGRRAP